MIRPKVYDRGVENRIKLLKREQFYEMKTTNIDVAFLKWLKTRFCTNLCLLDYHFQVLIQHEKYLQAYLKYYLGYW